jgi:hypothetical protein
MMSMQSFSGIIVVRKLEVAAIVTLCSEIRWLFVILVEGRDLICEVVSFAVGLRLRSSLLYS